MGEVKQVSDGHDTMLCEFNCLRCETKFDAPWNFNIETVICPMCKTEMTVEWDQTTDGWIGPWTKTIVEGG